MVCQKLCQDGMSGWGLLEESNIHSLYISPLRVKVRQIVNLSWTTRIFGVFHSCANPGGLNNHLTLFN